MELETKFRGKRVDNGEWITGNLFVPNKMVAGVYICPDTTIADFLPDYLDGDNLEEAERKRSGIALGHFHQVVPASVGQFTGQSDHFKVAIYAKDIVLVENEGDVITVCKCDKTGFNLEDLAGGSWARQLFHQPERLTVVGNVIDNPDLLK